MNIVPSLASAAKDDVFNYLSNVVDSSIVLEEGIVGGHEKAPLCPASCFGLTEI